MNVEFFECPLRAATGRKRHHTSGTLAISLRSVAVAAQFFVHSRTLSIFMSCVVWSLDDVQGPKRRCGGGTRAKRLCQRLLE
jgi:hypothetical protein